MPVGARRLSAQTDATDAAGGERGRARRGFPAGGGSTHNSLRRIGLSTFFRQSLLYMEGLCDLPGGGGRETGPKKAQTERESPGWPRFLNLGAERWKHFRCRALSARRGAPVAARGMRRMPAGAPRPRSAGNDSGAALFSPGRAPQSRLAERAPCLSAPADRAPCHRGFAVFDNRIGSGCTNEPFHGPPVVPTRRSHATRAAGRGKSTLASDFAPPSVKQITGGAIGAPELFPGHPRRRTTPRTRARRDRSLPDT